MNKVLTWAQIKARYRNQWVFINDAEFDEHLEVKRGEVICHSKDRSEIDRVVRNTHRLNGAILFTGPLIDEDVVAIL
jgi:hypothetical protein